MKLLRPVAARRKAHNSFDMVASVQKLCCYGTAYKARDAGQHSGWHVSTSLLIVCCKMTWCLGINFPCLLMMSKKLLSGGYATWQFNFNTAVLHTSLFLHGQKCNLYWSGEPMPAPGTRQRCLNSGIRQRCLYSARVHALVPPRPCGFFCACGVPLAPGPVRGPERACAFIFSVCHLCASASLGQSGLAWVCAPP